MKKLATLVFALMLTASLSFAQAGGGTGGSTGAAQTDTTKSDTGKKGHKGGKKGHKGGKKSKKGAGTETATPAPK
jgi:hypothetical protein